MKLRHLALAGLLPLLAAGCANVALSSTTLQPQQVDSLCPKNTAPDPIHILGTRHDQGKAVVLYETVCHNATAPAESVELLADSVFVRRGPFWYQIGSGSIGRTLQVPQPDPSEFIQFGVSSIHSGSGDRVKVFYGQILSSEVERVEVTLGTGEVLQDEGADNIFALFVPTDSPVCEVRVLGSNNQVLRRDTLNAFEQTDAGLSGACAANSSG